MDRIDLAVQRQDLVDGLTQVLQMVWAVEVGCSAGVGKRQFEDFPVESPRAGVLADVQPGGAADAGERIHDFRPGAADHLNLTAAATGSRCRLACSLCLRGKLALLCCRLVRSCCWRRLLSGSLLRRAVLSRSPLPLALLSRALLPRALR